MHKIKGSRSTSAASTTTSAISIYSRSSIFRRYLLPDTARVRSTNSKIAGAGSCWLASTRSSAASWRDVPLVDDLQEVMRGGIATFFVKEAHDLTFLLLLGHLDVCFIILCNHRESSAKAQQNCCWSLNADLRLRKYTTKISQRNKSDTLQWLPRSILNCPPKKNDIHVSKWDSY